MRIVGLHHAQITIPPGTESQARAFYCEVLGFPEILKPESLQGRGGFWLQVGEREVHVGTEETEISRLATKAHLAYQVTDVPAWKAHLEGREIQVVESVPIPGYRRFEFRDPFGNRLEFIEPVE